MEIDKLFKPLRALAGIPTSADIVGPAWEERLAYLAEKASKL